MCMSVMSWNVTFFLLELGLKHFWKAHLCKSFLNTCLESVLVHFLCFYFFFSLSLLMSFLRAIYRSLLGTIYTICLYVQPFLHPTASFCNKAEWPWVTNVVFPLFIWRLLAYFPPLRRRGGGNNLLFFFSLIFLLRYI